MDNFTCNLLKEVYLMVKRLLAVILICCLAFSMLAGCGSRSSDNDNDEPRKSASDISDNAPAGKADEEDKPDNKIDTGNAGNDSSKSKEYTVTLDLPEGWEESQEAGTSTLVAYQFFDQKTFDTRTFFVYKPSRMRGSNIEEHARLNAEAIESRFEDFEASEIKTITVAGYPAARYDLSVTFGGFEQVQIYVYVAIGKDVILVQGSYLPGDEKGADEFDAILASLKIE